MEPGPPENEELKKALCQYGPISIALLSTPKFQAYTGGVFQETLPDFELYKPGIFGGFRRYNVNHGVTLIGWDERVGDLVPCVEDQQGVGAETGVVVYEVEGGPCGQGGPNLPLRYVEADTRHQSRATRATHAETFIVPANEGGQRTVLDDDALGQASGA
jgi:hypothetical protein